MKVFKRNSLTTTGSSYKMKIVNFSKTNLPPILRIASSGDVPVRVVFSTSPAEARKTVRLINVVPPTVETSLIPPPQTGTITKLRRRRRQK